MYVRARRTERWSVGYEAGNSRGPRKATCKYYNKRKRGDCCSAVCRGGPDSCRSILDLRVLNHHVLIFILNRLIEIRLSIKFSNYLAVFMNEKKISTTLTMVRVINVTTPSAKMSFWHQFGSSTILYLISNLVSLWSNVCKDINYTNWFNGRIFAPANLLANLGTRFNKGFYDMIT